MDDRHAPVLAAFFLTDIVLPFLLLGALVGWGYRMAHDTGVDLYAGYLSTYGRAHGIAAVVLLTVVATSLSMAIRHQRHLAERPADLLRLPLFIVVSTFLLMPIRLVGFIRLAHAGSWGTRANAYRSSDDPLAVDPYPGDSRNGGGPAVELVTAAAGRPDRVTVADGGWVGPARSTPAPRLEPAPAATRQLDVREAPAPGARTRRPNLWALLPYLLALALLTLEVIYDV